MTTPRTLLALVDEHGIIRTFTGAAELAAHADALEPAALERLTVHVYRRVDPHPAIELGPGLEASAAAWVERRP